MSKDIMMFNGCDHIVNGIYYDCNTCPRCYGNNYYYDCAFDNKGKLVVCDGDIKLQQEVLKIMNDEKGGNKFHNEWGDLLVTTDVLHSIIGTKNINMTMQKVKMLVYETLQYLKAVQLNNQMLFKNMSENEIIDEILDINVTASGPDKYIIKVTFSNTVGQIYKQEIII